jgi:acyl-CoA thioesterase FadM
VSAAILTRWPAVVDVRIAARDLGPDGRPSDDALGRWFAAAQTAFLQRCPTLRAQLSRRGRALSVGGLRVTTRRSVRIGQTVRIAIAATELRSTSFEMALRVRALGEDGGPVADGRCSIGWTERADGRPAPIPDEITSELIELAATATEYC